MKDESLLKKYINEILQEDLRRTSKGNEPSFGNGILRRIASFFTSSDTDSDSSSEEITEKFIEVYESQTDISIPYALRRSMIEYAQQAYPYAVQRARGNDPAKFLAFMLRKKFMRILTKLETEKYGDHY